jgi:plastocyanin
MTRRSLLVLVALLVAVVLPGAGRADNPVLVGDVGVNDSFSINLVDASGAKVTHLDPGTYTVLVHDHSSMHNFHLFGPGGVDVMTQIGDIGDFTFTVTLVDGTYRYQCDPHFTFMKGSFTVGTPPPPPPPVRLLATVGPGLRIAVRFADGSPLAGLTAGRARIVVRDRSRRDNFHLRGPGVSKSTGVAFRGTVTWKVTLRAGTYTFRSDRHKSLRGRFVVTG